MNQVNAILFLILTLMSTPVAGQLVQAPIIFDNPPAKLAAQKILTTDWARSPEREKQSKSTFGSAASDDANLLYAYALNRMQHNRHREAKRTTNELTTKYPKHIDGWILHAWLNALTDDFDVCCSNLRSIKKNMGQVNLDVSAQKRAYHRIGSLIGYLEGPVKKRVNEELLAATIALLEKDSPPEVLTSMKKSRLRVDNKFKALAKEQETRTKLELGKVENSNNQEIANLKNENQVYDQSIARIGPEKDRLRKEASEQISSLERQASDLEQQLSGIGNDIRQTSLNLDAMYRDLNRAVNGPFRGQYSVFLIENEIRNAQFNLTSLQNSGVLLTNQLSMARNQIVQTRNAYSNRIKDLENEIKRLSARKKRNGNRLTKLAKGPEIADGKWMAMRNKITALRTFDDIPIELYREELLGALTK